MPIYLGSSEVNKIYLGSNKVKKIYLGTSVIFNTISTVTVNLLGAPSETISITGATTASVNLNSSGIGQATVNVGSNTFEGSVSGYSTTRSISADCDVNVYPSGSIYWFGRYIKQIGLEGSMSNFAITDYTNYLNAHAFANGSQQAFALSTVSKIDVTDYTKIRARFNDKNNRAGMYLSYLSTRSQTYSTAQVQLARGTQKTGTTISLVTVDITSITGSWYIGIGTWEYDRTGNYDTEVRCIYLA